MYIYVTRSGVASAPTGREASPGVVESRAAEGRDAASDARRRPRAPEPPSGEPRDRLRASPRWRDAPVLQEGDRPLELLGGKPVRVRVLDQRNTPRRKRHVASGQDVRDRQGMGDREAAPLGALEHEPKAAESAQER